MDKSTKPDRCEAATTRGKRCSNKSVEKIYGRWLCRAHSRNMPIEPWDAGIRRAVESQQRRINAGEEVAVEGDW